ncbi:putative gustatory receptor 28b isoform X4 [Rhodnius prolixus]
MHLFIYLLLILVYIHYLTNIKDTIYTKVMAAVFLFTSVANIMVLYQFTYVMDIIIQLMKKINKEMESTEQFKSAVSGNLKLLTEQHNHLMDSAQIVNKIFSWQILTICLRSFMELTCHNYGLLVNLTKDYDKNIQDRIWHIFRILLNITEISTIVHFCEYFSKEAKKFNTYLFQYLRNKQMEFTKAEFDLHYYSLMKREIIFTAAGFFDLGYPLITTMIGTTVTFLVIVVQFTF